MQLSTLLAGLPADCAGVVVELGGGASAQGLRDCEVSCVVEDSRAVVPGALFVARSGTKTDGAKFVRDAIAGGAVAVLTADAGLAREVSAGGRAAGVLTSNAARAGALLAHAMQGNPGRELRAFGVTGTNGKTTVSYLVYQLVRALRVQGNSLGCGLVGTVAIDDGDGLHEASMTTPPAGELAASLARMRRAGYSAVAMEVSSHALDQHRAEGLAFAAAAFTNLTGDHLDYHGTMEAYASAKARLFGLVSPGGVAIVNVLSGNAWHETMLRACDERGVRVMRVGATAHEPEAWGLDASVLVHGQSLAGLDATIAAPFGAPMRVRVPLVGTYNAVNVLQAALGAHAIGVACGLDSGLVWQKILAEVPTLEAPPGRLERVSAARSPFGVFVDYAHSDDSLRNVLIAARACMGGAGRLWCVFGCGGDRDRTKRPRMGLAAAELADAVVVTSDNPRSEDPEAIVDEVLAGVPDALRGKVHREVQRASAIEHAVREARAGDVVLIAGKGHETYQILPDGKGGTVRTDFDDRKVARAALGRRGTHEVLSAEGQAQRGPSTERAKHRGQCTEAQGA
jgi:UDP-N-acetylmuramyl-tripeptide synthetase